METSISLQNGVLWSQGSTVRVCSITVDGLTGSPLDEVVKAFSGAGCQAYCESCSPHFPEDMNGLPMGFHENYKSIVR